MLGGALTVFVRVAKQPNATNLWFSEEKSCKKYPVYRLESKKFDGGDASGSSPAVKLSKFTRIWKIFSGLEWSSFIRAILALFLSANLLFWLLSVLRTDRYRFLWFHQRVKEFLHNFYYYLMTATFLYKIEKVTSHHLNSTSKLKKIITKKYRLGYFDWKKLSASSSALNCYLFKIKERKVFFK